RATWAGTERSRSGTPSTCDRKRGRGPAAWGADDSSVFRQGLFALRRAHGADVRRIPVKKSPRLAGPVPGLVHADALAAREPRPGIGGRWFDPQWGLPQVGAVQTPIYVHCPAKQAGAVRPVGNAGDRLESANQHRVRDAFGGGHDVEAVPEPVDEIDVCVARR